MSEYIKRNNYWHWLKMLGLAGIFVILTACESKKASEFMEQESTINEAKQLVEDGMMERGLTVKAGKVQYAREGKGQNTSLVMVDYEIKHEPKIPWKGILARG